MSGSAGSGGGAGAVRKSDIGDPTLEACQEAAGYRFKNLDLLAAALTHSSVASSRLLSNERMEFLGDAVLGLVICQALYERFPDYMEGDLTKLKSTVVSRQSCAQVAEAMKLADFMLLGKGMYGRTYLPQSLSAAAVEALIGAIYLDGGLAPAAGFILRRFGPVIDEAVASGHLRNFKSILQQFAQRELGASPIYQVLDEKGPDHAKCFEICVLLNGRRFGSAWGPNKKEAEQLAARQALTELAGEHDDPMLKV